jgi:hypothetical protein
VEFGRRKSGPKRTSLRKRLPVIGDGGGDGDGDGSPLLTILLAFFDLRSTISAVVTWFRRSPQRRSYEVAQGMLWRKVAKYVLYYLIATLELA